VVGFNLTGQYTNSIATTQYTTTQAIDCTSFDNVQLSFWRWLGIESSANDHASIQVSNDGTTWTTVWDHTGGTLNETAWSFQQYDISAVASFQSTVYIRWGMGTTNGSVTFSGWNIDDVRVAGTLTAVSGIDVLGLNFNVISDNFFLAGGQAAANFAFRNLGDTAAGAFDVQFYLSDDANIDPATDLLLTLSASDPNYDPTEPEAFHVSGLGSLATQTASVALTVPVSDPFGTDNQYFVGMVVDADGDIAEADEANNRNRGTGLDRDDVEYTDNIASFPFFENWESGPTFRPMWQVIPGVEGRIQITSANAPFQGLYHVTMDDATASSQFSLNQLILHINLAGKAGVRLQYANKEFGDEDNTQDSVDVSIDGGATWRQVVPLTGTNSSSTYTARSYDLSTLGLTFTADTLIRFQQYDDNAITTDGMAFDNIRVDSIATPGIDVSGMTFDVVPDNFFAAHGLVTANFGLRNLGDTAAGAFDVKFYLSDDSNIDPATDMLLTLAVSDPNFDPSEPEAYHVSGLGSVATHTGSVLLSVPVHDPFGTDNQYYLGMVVDADGNVAESDETNNRNRGQALDRDDVEYSDSIASFPFFEDWESGTTFRPMWQVIPGAEGRIQITSANTPYQGTYHVTLDDSVDGSLNSLNKLILHEKLAGRTGDR
jgi:hypothetical protein